MLLSACLRLLLLFLCVGNTDATESDPSTHGNATCEFMDQTTLLQVGVRAGSLSSVFAPPLQQFTPDQADWTTMNKKPLDVSVNTAHDPDGVGWIKMAKWEAAKWDGKTTYNPSKMSRMDFWKAICPSVDTIRGIREVFYEVKPFADNMNPTKAEVDEWHRIALNHVRKLIGYTSEDRKVKKDACMFARSLWGQQRRFTRQWDAAYPGKQGSAYGPCETGKNAHCGALFIPNDSDQVPYLPPGHAPCRRAAGAEGVFGAPKCNIPWSLKWSRGLCNTLIAEGFWGGHVGPFFHREKFGFSFWDSDPRNKNNICTLRAKWTGRLMKNLYCNPSQAGCGPDKTGPEGDPNWEGGPLPGGTPPAPTPAPAPAPAPVPAPAAEPSMQKLSFPSRTRCKGRPLMLRGKAWGNLGRGTSEEQCKKACVDEAACKYVMYFTKRKVCTAFGTCKQFKSKFNFAIFKKTS